MRGNHNADGVKPGHLGRESVANKARQRLANAVANSVQLHREAATIGSWGVSSRKWRKIVEMY
jgi:hypothetical protein